MSWLECMSSTLVGLPGDSWQNLPCEAWLHLVKLHFHAGASDMAKPCRNEKFSCFSPLWAAYITSWEEQLEISTPLHSDILRRKNKFKHLEPLVKPLCFAHWCEGNLESKTHLRRRHKLPLEKKKKKFSVAQMKKSPAGLGLCHNKMSQREWLQQQKRISLRSQVKGQASWILWWELHPGLQTVYLSLCCHMRGREALWYLLY